MWDMSSPENWVKKSEHPHLEPGLRFFAAPKICKKEMVGGYHGFLVYVLLTRGWHQIGTYAKELMQMTAERFRKMWNQLPDKDTGKDKNDKKE